MSTRREINFDKLIADRWCNISGLILGIGAISNCVVVACSPRLFSCAVSFYISTSMTPRCRPEAIEVREVSVGSSRMFSNLAPIICSLVITHDRNPGVVISIVDTEVLQFTTGG